MFESIVNFFKKIGKQEKEQVKSKDAAKERLHLVLMQDRANVSADFLDLMKQEIIEVIKKYIDVDENAIDVRLTNKANTDGTTGAPALYANIPITSIKEDVKSGMARQKNNNVEEVSVLDKKESEKNNGTIGNNKELNNEKTQQYTDKADEKKQQYSDEAIEDKNNSEKFVNDESNNQYHDKNDENINNTQYEKNDEKDINVQKQNGQNQAQNSNYQKHKPYNGKKNKHHKHKYNNKYNQEQSLKKEENVDPIEMRG